MTERTITESELESGFRRYGGIGRAGFVEVLDALGITVVPDPAPPLPTEPGAVVRDALGGVWVRQHDAYWLHARRGSLEPESEVLSIPERFPFERLYTAEDFEAQREAREAS